MIRVGVLGALGKMGTEVCRAVDADERMSLAAVVDVAFDGTSTNDGIVVSADKQALVDAGCDVVVDFTHPSAVESNLRFLIDRRIHAVVGTTGLDPAVLRELGELAAAAGLGLFVAPNFAIGAVLMMRFAADAAKHLPFVEIVELHHDQKADAPSGTALATARAIGAARTGDAPKRRVESVETTAGARGADVGDQIRIHSVRLPGLIAHQEVLLGGPGQTLTIRHDSLDRAGFMPGVLLAIAKVRELRGLTVGLEHLL